VIAAADVVFDNDIKIKIDGFSFAIPTPGTIAPAIAADIENSDRTTRLEAAHFRFSRRLRELESQFEAEASKLRQTYCDECAEIWEGGE